MLERLEESFAFPALCPLPPPIRHRVRSYVPLPGSRLRVAGGTVWLWREHPQHRPPHVICCSTKRADIASSSDHSGRKGVNIQISLRICTLFVCLSRCLVMLDRCIHVSRCVSSKWNPASASPAKWMCIHTETPACAVTPAKNMIVLLLGL